jgi:hypothetical protein
MFYPVNPHGLLLKYALEEPCPCFPKSPGVGTLFHDLYPRLIPPSWQRVVMEFPLKRGGPASSGSAAGLDSGSPKPTETFPGYPSAAKYYTAGSIRLLNDRRVSGDPPSHAPRVPLPSLQSQLGPKGGSD